MDLGIRKKKSAILYDTVGIGNSGHNIPYVKIGNLEHFLNMRLIMLKLKQTHLMKMSIEIY